MKKLIAVLLVGLGAGLSGCGRKEAVAAADGPIVLNYANFPPAATFPCVQM